jgi:acetyl esterase/lipase
MRPPIFFIPLFFILSGALSACSGADAVNLFVSEEGYSVTKDIAYGELPRQKLDMYLPEKIDANTPLIVFFYGGAWQGGKKADYLFVAQGLTSLGYAVAVPDYRTYPEVKYPAFIEDSAQAVTWVYEHAKTYKLNRDNLHLMGHSAGAYNAMMLALNQKYLEKAGGKSEWIKGVIGLAGPYNFLPLRDRAYQEIFSTEPDLIKTQPIHYARRNAPRILLLTGRQDNVVAPRNSYYLYGVLQELGNDVTYKEYDGVGHVNLALELSKTLSNKSEMRSDIQDFIAKGMKKPTRPALAPAAKPSR